MAFVRRSCDEGADFLFLLGCANELAVGVGPEEVDGEDGATYNKNINICYLNSYVNICCLNRYFNF